MHSHGHVPLKVTLLITTHHMTVRSCDPESVQYEATTKTITLSSLVAAAHMRSNRLWALVAQGALMAALALCALCGCDLRL